MKKVLLSLFIVACLFVVTGCGSKKSSANMAGTYKLVEMKEGETTISADLLKTVGIEYKLTVKDDKTATLDMGDTKQSLKYDDKYFYAADSEAMKMSYTFKNGKITMKQDDSSMTFEK